MSRAIRLKDLNLLALASPLLLCLQLGCDVGDDQQRADDGLLLEDRLEREREVTVPSVEALRQLLERDLRRQEALDDLLPSELQEESQLLVAAGESVVEGARRLRVPNSASNAAERSE